MTCKNKTPKKPIKFEEFCNFYGVYHYGAKHTYNNINTIWKMINKKMQKHQLLFPNFELFINYLKEEYETVQAEYKFIHLYIINEFNKYQINAEKYFQNFNNYNKRLIGYSKKNNCRNMNDLKQSLNGRIKRIKYDSNDDDDKESKNEFLVIARYICDYIEEFPEEEIQKELFNF